MAKREGYSISGKRLDWIPQFLIGRKQRVGLAGSFSEWTMVLSGVPQDQSSDEYSFCVTSVTCWK